MKDIVIKFGTESVKAKIPENTDVLAMTAPKILQNPKEAIKSALYNCEGTPPLKDVIKNKLSSKSQAKAVIVISDNTRPVPYRGEAGILQPLVEELLSCGVAKDNILILVATGTHRPLQDKELKAMLDPKVFEYGIKIENHDCKDENNLVDRGFTQRGTKISVNKKYIDADIKILTGLVESHFMAGASGGRKSICPGIIGEQGTYMFHGAQILASPDARDLVLQGNPCHEEALEVAKKAGADFIVNVTLDHRFNLTGVFAGELEQAHLQAVNHIRQYTSFPIEKEYDIVVTHAGFVGINHYQAAKAAIVAKPVVKPGGMIIMPANNTDTRPIGSFTYQTILHLLKLIGPKRFNKLILSEDWQFLPEQWQVQMWAKLFSKIPQQNFIYYSPQLTKEDYSFIPGKDGNLFLPVEQQYQSSLQTIPKVIEKAINFALEDCTTSASDEISIAFLQDGPYGIAVNN